MKYLLVTLPLLILVGCQNSSNNDGYDFGYNLTCGFSSTKANRLVVESRFANDFLEGAIACAHDHPERARQVLGLATEQRPHLEPQAGTQTAPGVTAQSGGQESAAAPPQVANVENNLKGHKARSAMKTHAARHPTTRTIPKRKAHTMPDSHRRAKAHRATGVSASAKSHATAKSHPPAKAHATGTTHPKAKAAPTTTTHATVKTPPKAKVAAVPGKRSRTPASRSTDYGRPAKTAPAQQTRHKGVDSYLGFMGE
jgi:hypothetical protein